jgi:general secretion pathway protein C
MHLFGVANKAPVVSDAPIEATETKLKLTLRGVFAATDPKNAMAIIADAKGEEKVYQKAETIFSGVKLYEIYPDKVILERGGSFETLSLPRDEEPASSRPAFASSRTARPTTRLPQTDDVTRTRNIRAGNKLDQLKEKLTAEPAEFWKEVRIEPVQDENNQIKGYRFNHNDPQVMRALGLRPGDVILEVNGSPVSDPSVLTGLLNDMGSQGTLSLGIERNGQRENLNIQM